MSVSNLERARAGFAAIQRGDLEAIAELLDPEVKWHGGDPTAEGACQNRGQALEFIRQGRRLGRIGKLVDVIDVGDDRVVVVMQPPDEDGVTPPRRANVTTFRDGKVVEMIAFESPEAALAHARRRAG